MINDELVEQASELTNLADRLELIERVLENLEYARSKKGRVFDYFSNQTRCTWEHK